MKEKKIRIQWELSRNGPTIAPFLRVSIWPGPASVRWICCVAAWMSSWLTLDRTASWSRPAECDCWAMDTLGSGVWCVVFYGLLMMIINDYSLVLFYSIWHSMLYHSIIYIHTVSILLPESLCTPILIAVPRRIVKPILGIYTHDHRCSLPIGCFG